MDENKKRGLFKYLLALLLFPLKVRKRYLKFSSVLFEAEGEHKATSEQLKAYRENNLKLINRFIHLPLGIFALTFVAMFYLNIGELLSFGEKLIDLPKVSLIKPKATQVAFKKYATTLSAQAEKMHFSRFVFILGISYAVMFLGASVLVANPAFKNENLIKSALLSNRYTDPNGQPWKVFWTPDVIIFYTYQCDSDAFQNNAKFWNTINFRPDTPVHFRSDANKILVPRAYALPSFISFELKENA